MKIKNIARQVFIYTTSPFVTFSAGAVVVMLLDVYITKGMDSSFVSACMDVVMAGAAVGAVLIARNYLAQFTAQEGYKIAIELVNDVFPKHERLKTVVPRCNTALTIVNKVIEHESSSEKEVSILKSILSECNRMSEDANSVYREINKLLFKTKTYGLYPSNERDYYFYNFINTVGLVSSELKELANDLGVVYENIEVCRKSKNQAVVITTHDASFDNNALALDRIKNNFLSLRVDEVNATFKQMSSSHDNFIGKDNTITELFKVKGLLF